MNKIILYLFIGLLLSSGVSANIDYYRINDSAIMIKMDVIANNPYNININNANTYAPTSYENIVNFYDDFEDNSINNSKWTCLSTCDETNGKLVIGDDQADTDRIQSIKSFGKGNTIIMNAKWSTTTASSHYLGLFPNTGGTTFISTFQYQPNYRIRSNDFTSENIEAIDTNNYKEYKIKWKNDGNSEFYINNNLKGSINNNNIEGQGVIYIISYDANKQVYLEDITIINDDLKGVNVSCNNNICTIESSYNMSNKTFILNTTFSENIRVIDDQDIKFKISGSENNFNATINDIDFYSTTNGTIITNINKSDNEIINITIIPLNNIYQTYNFINYNTSTNIYLNFELNRYLYNITVYDLNNNLVEDFTLTTNINISTNGSVWIESGVNNITFTKNGYYPLTLNVNVTSNTDYDLQGVYNSLLNVSIRKFSDNTSLSNFNYSTNYGFSGFTSNSYIALPSMIGNITHYNISLSNYATIVNNYNLTNNYNAIYGYFYTYNSVDIYFYHEENRTLINDRTININTISDYMNQINTTTDGSLTIDFLAPNDYELRVSTENKSSRSYFVTVTDDSTQTLNIFLADNDSVSNIRVKLYDTGGNVISNAIIRMQKQYSGTVNWIIVEDGRTNSQGLTDFYVETGSDVFYRFIIIYNGVVIATTDATNFLEGLTDDIYEITTSLSGEFGTPLPSAVNSVLYFNGSGVFYRFIDSQTRVNQGQLLVYSNTFANFSTNNNLVCNTTFVASTGDIFCPITFVNNTYYYAVGLVYYQDTPLMLIEAFYNHNITFKFANENDGLLYAIGLFIIIVAVGLSLGLLASLLISFVSLGFLSYIHIVSLPLGLITSLIAISIILFFNIRKNP